jgi:hypothetical protein
MQGAGMPEFTIRDAAAHFGVSADTIRRRIRRGELPTRRDARGWHLVIVPDAGDAHGTAARPMQGDALPQAAPTAELGHLHEEIAYLRAALEREQQASAELRRMLNLEQQTVAAAQQATLLAAPGDAQMPPQAPERPENPPATPETMQTPSPQKPRSWWRRWRR